METPKKTIAFLIGHSRYIKGRRDGGAYSNVLGMSEWNFSMSLVPLLKDKLASKFNLIVISKYQGNSYGKASDFVAAELRREKVLFAAESHFNAAAPHANGHEWIYWHSSSNSRRFAEIASDTFSRRFPSIHRRKILARTSERQNGGSMLRRTHCPLILLEPFFGSNPRDAAKFKQPHNVVNLADCYAEIFTLFSETL